MPQSLQKPVYAPGELVYVATANYVFGGQMRSARFRVLSRSGDTYSLRRLDAPHDIIEATRADIEGSFPPSSPVDI